jgi:membrane protein YqaA with SNARE-associated domain
MWNRFAFVALGISCFVASAFIPAAAPYLIVAGAALTGVAVPSQAAAPVVDALRGKTDK